MELNIIKIDYNPTEPNKTVQKTTKACPKGHKKPQDLMKLGFLVLFTS